MSTAKMYSELNGIEKMKILAMRGLIDRSLGNMINAYEKAYPPTIYEDMLRFVLLTDPYYTLNESVAPESIWTIHTESFQEEVFSKPIGSRHFQIDDGSVVYASCNPRNHPRYIEPLTISALGYQDNYSQSANGEFAAVVISQDRMYRWNLGKMIYDVTNNNSLEIDASGRNTVLLAKYFGWSTNEIVPVSILRARLRVLATVKDAEDNCAPIADSLVNYMDWTRDYQPIESFLAFINRLEKYNNIGFSAIVEAFFNGIRETQTVCEYSLPIFVHFAAILGSISDLSEFLRRYM